MEGKTFDDVLEEKARAGEAWDFAERRFRPKRAKKGGKGGEDVEMQAEGGSVDTSTVPTSTAASSIDKSEFCCPSADGLHKGGEADIQYIDAVAVANVGQNAV